MRVYRRALAYFRQDMFRVSLLIVMVGLSIGLGLLQAWPMAVLVDAVLTPTPHLRFFHRIFLALLPDNRLAQVIGITLIGMALKMVQDTVWTLRVMLNNRIKYNGVTRMRGDLYNKLQSLDAAYHATHPQGDAIYRLSNDVFGAFGILDTFIALGCASVTLIVMLVTMVSANWTLTCIALSITPAMIWVNLHFGRTIKHRTAESKQIDADFTTFIQRAISSFTLIQLFGRQRDVSKQFDQSVHRSTRAWMRMNWQEQLYPLSVNFIYAIGGALIFGYGGYLVWRDQFAHPVANAATLGELMVFMAYLGDLWAPLRALTGFSATIQTHVAATERVFAVLDTASQVDEPAGGGQLLELKPRTIELDNVEFSHVGGSAVLRGISARIEPGEMVAFLGKSGTGKSTLLHLLPRFFDPSAGSVRLDGIDLRDICLSDVRRHVALVSQECTIVAASIADNIAFGRPDASFEEIHEAACLAGADEFIQRLPQSYDTLLAENGSNLSGGQRQRIAIARALLTRAPILVLDEPTSAQDIENESQIMETLRSLKGKRTVILVTHRVDSVEFCDRVLVLNAGKIVQRTPTSTVFGHAA